MSVPAGQPSELWLLRHAATEWSGNGRHTGCRSDIPLTEEGRSAARRLATVLGGISFDLVLASPLQRTLETARLAGLGDAMRIEPDLREWDYGDLEGLTTPQIRERYPQWTIWSGPIPGGESPDAVAARARRVIDRIRGVGGRVALVSHGHFSRVFTATWLGLDPREGSCFALDTGTYSILGWEHEYPTMRRWNEQVQPPAGAALGPLEARR